MNDGQTIYKMHSAKAILLLLVGATKAHASPGDGVATLPIGTSDLLNVGGGLIFVVLAIIVLGIVYARTQGLRAGTNGVINVIATQALGPKERIAIIEIADQQILIGMTTSSVQTLHVFDKPVAIAPEVPASFSSRLKKFMRGDGE